MRKEQQRAKQLFQNFCRKIFQLRLKASKSWEFFPNTEPQKEKPAREFGKGKLQSQRRKRKQPRPRHRRISLNNIKFYNRRLICQKKKPQQKKRKKLRRKGKSQRAKAR